VTSEPARSAAIVRLYDEVSETLAEFAMGGRVVSASIRYATIGTMHVFSITLDGIDVSSGSGACADVAAHRAWADLTGRRTDLAPTTAVQP